MSAEETYWNAVSLLLGRPGQYALVDADDFPSLCQSYWHVYTSPHGIKYARTAVYNPVSVRKKLRFNFLRMHRIIMNAPRGVIIDHINGDGLDNRRSNLRFATAEQNAQNGKKRRHGKSRFKGVSYSKAAGKWEAAIRHAGKQVHIGFFDIEDDAAAAYDAKAEEFHGEFARTNVDLGLRKSPEERP